MWTCWSIVWLDGQSVGNQGYIISLSIVQLGGQTKCPFRLSITSAWGHCCKSDTRPSNSLVNQLVGIIRVSFCLSVSPSCLLNADAKQNNM